MSVSERRIYRTLIALLPSDFRARNSAAMEDLFAEALAESRRRGRLAPLGTWLRGTLDIVGYAVRSLVPGRGSAGSSRRGAIENQFGGGAGPSRPNGPGLLTGILEDVRYAIRRLKRAPLMTGIAIAVAGIGIGAATATFSVLDAVILRPLPYPDADRLVQITQKTTPAGVSLGRTLRDDTPINAQDFLVYEAETASFSHWAWTGEYEPGRDATVGGGDGAPQGVEVIQVSASFFSTLGAVLPLGRPFLPGERAPPNSATPGRPWQGVRWTGVVIISHDLWSSRFGSDPDIVGKDIVFEGGPSTVVGVTPPDFRFPPMSERGEVRERDIDVFLPLVYPAFLQPRTFLQFGVLARMKPGVEAEQAQADVSRIFDGLAAEYPVSHVGRAVVVTPLHDLLVRDYGLVFFSLMGMVGLVFLVACANLASLALAQGTRRRAELALRAAIGGGRARLFRLLMAESLILAALGGVLGLLLARWGTAALIAMVPADLTRAADAGLDGRVLLFALALSVATGVLFGLVPALRSSDVDLVHDLKSGGRSGTGMGGSTLSRSLITGQVALTLVLLIGGGLLGKSFLRLRTNDLGYDPANILTVTINQGYLHRFSRISFNQPEMRRVRWRASTEIMERVRALPGVRSVASGDIQIDGTGFYPVQFRSYPEEGDVPPEELVNSFATYVSPEYFATMGIPLVRGHELPAWNGVGDAERYWWSAGPDGPEVLVSETFAATAWPGEDPIGKELGVYGCCWTVAGVVADVDSRGVDAPALAGRLGREPRLMIYIPYMELGPYLIKTDVDPLSLVAAVRDIVVSVDAQAAVTFSTMEQQVADSLARPRFYSVVAAIFGGVALVMALVGLYGVMAYAVGRRVHEIGVRMALGAERAQIRAMVVGEGMRPVLLGVVLGLAASAALVRVLEGLLYGMDALDPWLGLSVAVAMIAVSIAACYSPARHASQVDPLRALAHE